MAKKYSIEELKALKADDLKEIARSNKLKGFSLLKKNELVDFIFERIGAKKGSPVKKAVSKRSRSPAKRSRSPVRKSPAKRSRSPAKKTARKSPAKRSRSPAKKTARKSPAKRSRSPAKKTARKSPAKRSRSPAKKAVRKSPAKKSRSPAKRSRSPAYKGCEVTPDCPKGYKRDELVEKAQKCGVSVREGGKVKNMKELCRDLKIAHGGLEEQVEEVLEEGKELREKAPKKSPKKSPAKKAAKKKGDPWGDGGAGPIGCGLNPFARVQDYTKEQLKDIALRGCGYPEDRIRKLDKKDLVRLLRYEGKYKEQQTDCIQKAPRLYYTRDDLINMATTGCGYTLDKVEGLSDDEIYSLVGSGPSKNQKCVLEFHPQFYGKTELLEIAELCGLTFDDDATKDEIYNSILLLMKQQREDEIEDALNNSKEGLDAYLTTISKNKSNNLSVIKSCETVLDNPHLHDYFINYRTEELARDMGFELARDTSEGRGCRIIYDKLRRLSYNPRELLYGQGVNDSIPGKYRKKYCRNEDEPVDMIPIDEIPDGKFIRLSSGGCYNVDNVVSYIISNNLGNKDMVAAFERRNVPAWANENELTEILNHRGLDPNILSEYLAKEQEIIVVNKKKIDDFFSNNLDLLNAIGITGFIALSDNPSSFEGRDEVFKMAQKALADLFSRINEIDEELRDTIKSAVTLNKGTMTFGEVLAESGSTCIHGTGFKLMDIYLAIYTKLSKKPELLDFFLTDKKGSYLTFHVSDTKVRGKIEIATVIYTPSTGYYGRDGYVDYNGSTRGMYNIAAVDGILKANGLTLKEFYDRSTSMADTIFEEIEEMAAS